MWRDQREGGPVRLHGDAGAVAVEAAFVMPILVFLIFAIYAVCIGLNAKTELTGAVREGARAGALSTDPDSVAVTTTVRTVVRAAAPGLNGPGIGVTISTPVCASPSDPASMTVTATYQVPVSVPFLRITQFSITESAVMRCGL